MQRKHLVTANSVELSCAIQFILQSDLKKPSLSLSLGLLDYCLQDFITFLSFFAFLLLLLSIS